MKVFLPLVFSLLVSCSEPQKKRPVIVTQTDTAQEQVLPTPPYDGNEIETGNTTPQQIVAFAHTLIGTPYKYASIDPEEGFDCSGFITHVFNHFNIAVPRSSVNFTNVGRQVKVSDAKPGDLVLFTGTDKAIRTVGHMGIVTSNSNHVFEFIHSTSGKAYGVTITPLNDYYMGRFMKVIRIFRQNDD